MSEVKKKKKMSGSKKFLIFLIIVALIAGGGYIGLNQYFSGINKFPSGTTINGVNVSGMPVDYAAEVLTDAWNDRSLTITENGVTKATISDFNFDYQIKAQVECCLQPDFFDSLIRLVNPKERQYTIRMTVAESSRSFDEQFDAMSIVQEGEGTVQSENAYVDLSTTDFNVVDEVYGNNLDKDKLKEDLFDAIAEGKDTFEYYASNYYEQPEITADSEEIQEELAYAQKYLTAEITYESPQGDMTLTPAEIDSMIKVDENGAVKARKKAIRAFVDTVAEKYNTVGISRTMHLAGGTVTMSGGNYGYVVDKEAEAKQLRKDLVKLEDVKRKPIYEQEGWGNGKDDIGDTYVETDISRQHVWCVVDGKTVVSTDVVTGNVSEGNGTPCGIFPLMYKTSPATLEGENADGSKYKTPVTYWMPFYAGCGFHDATWRSAFGGTIYQGGGSHGCVNMPYSEAKKLYGYVEAGMPIIVHE